MHIHMYVPIHTHIHTHKCNQFDGAGADEFPENVGEPVAERIIEYTRVPIDTTGCTGWLWLKQYTNNYVCAELIQVYKNCIMYCSKLYCTLRHFA